MLLRATCENRSDARDSELSRFFDGPLEAIEFEDGEEQMEGKGGLNQHLFMQQKNNLFRLYGDDGGTMKVPSCDHIEDLTGLRAEHECEVPGLRASERCMRFRPCVGDPAASSHRVCKHTAPRKRMRQYEFGACAQRRMNTGY